MKNGVEQLHIVYPKFKNGEAVVRNVKVQQNFGMYKHGQYNFSYSKKSWFDIPFPMIMINLLKVM